MERFVLSGKAKTVFEIIALMAKGEEQQKREETAVNKEKAMLENSYRLWPAAN